MQFDDNVKSIMDEADVISEVCLYDLWHVIHTITVVALMKKSFKNYSKIIHSHIF